MLNVRFSALAAGLCAAFIAAAAANAPLRAQQVGYPPAGSPFRDLEYRQELTLFGGYYAAAKDPARVAPRSGPMVGVRYEAAIGGPAQLMARLGYVWSERRTLDPTAPAASRELGTRSIPLLLTDVGISLNLTGQKSWHHIVPFVSGGFGFVSAGKSSVEKDPYRFGTTFALIYGTGFRFVPGGRLQARVGLDSYLYRIAYPDAYFLATSDGTSVVKASQVRSFWKNNAALTVGGSYLFFR